jgi:hypothetical protein
MSSEPTSESKFAWTPKAVVLVAIPVLLLTLLIISVAQRGYAEPLFIHTTYYFLMVTVATWAATYLYAARNLKGADVLAWIKDNKSGIIAAVVVTAIAGLAIHPALRVLADEANLLGTSRNFFFSKTATFTTTGKYYYDNFWDAGVVIDRRPSLFPFLVSLIHVVRGYSYTNVFLFNLIILPVFVLVAYRIAKSLAGEVFGLAACLFVVAHPITLISMRSGGFDFFSALFALLVAHSFLAHSRSPSPERLAVLWMNLCMYAEIRYETALFLPPTIVLLLVFRLVKWEYLKRFAMVYVLSPAYLLPRFWQNFLRGNVPEQDPGTVTFSLQNFLDNSRDYFKPILNPFNFHPPHSAIVIALGVVGSLIGLHWWWRRLRARDWQAPDLRFGTMVIGWMVLQIAIVFTYVWGRALHPAAARLVITIDTFFAFPAAWTLVWLLKRFLPRLTVLVSAAVFAVYLPVASEYRVLNELTLTREAATTWRFFESLHEKRIMIMEYGALDFETAKRDSSLLEALSRRLFYDIYLVQQVDLSTHKVLPQYEIWPDRPRETMIEFQNDANATVRISRLVR